MSEDEFEDLFWEPRPRERCVILYGPIGWQKQSMPGTAPDPSSVDWFGRWANGSESVEDAMTDEQNDTTQQPLPMTHERLAAIHGRLMGISAWPWRRAPLDMFVVLQRQWTDGADDLFAAKVSSNADAQFVAHAPEDVDALLAEVDRLRTLVEALCNYTAVRVSDAEDEREFDEMMRRWGILPKLQPPTETGA